MSHIQFSIVGRAWSQQQEAKHITNCIVFTIFMKLIKHEALLFIYSFWGNETQTENSLFSATAVKNHNLFYTKDNLTFLFVFENLHWHWKLESFQSCGLVSMTFCFCWVSHTGTIRARTFNFLINRTSHARAIRTRTFNRS